MDITQQVESMLNGLMVSPEPYAWSSEFDGLTHETTLVYPLSIPEIDGGGIDMWEAIAPQVLSDVEVYLADVEPPGLDPIRIELDGIPELTSFKIVSASLRVETNEPSDEYEHYLYLGMVIIF